MRETEAEGVRVGAGVWEGGAGLVLSRQELQSCKTKSVLDTDGAQQRKGPGGH